MSIFVEEDDGFRILFAGSHKVLVQLQFGKRVGVEMVNTTTPADREETAILVRHLHQFCKQSPSARLRHGTLVACLAKAPELLSIVPAKEVREGLEEILESVKVSILNVSMTSRCWLAAEPHAIGLTYSSP